MKETINPTLLRANEQLQLEISTLKAELEMVRKDRDQTREISQRRGIELASQRAENERLMAFVNEVATPPYVHSDMKSLVAWMRRRAKALQSAAKLDEKGTCMNQSEFKIGDIIRYGSGPTALMRIDHISENHGIEDRYYGKQCYGSAMGVYRSDAKHASQEDIKTWERENGPAKQVEGK
jgi:hypothetical protein